MSSSDGLQEQLDFYKDVSFPSKKRGGGHLQCAAAAKNDVEHQLAKTELQFNGMAATAEALSSMHGNLADHTERLDEQEARIDKLEGQLKVTRSAPAPALPCPCRLPTPPGARH